MADDYSPNLSSLVEQGFGLAADAEDYEDALKQDAWTWTEALCWLKGRLPDECRAHQLPKHYPQEVDTIHRAIRAGALTKDASTPREWADWAAAKGWAIPCALSNYSITHMGSLSAEAAPDLPPGHTTPKGRVKKAPYADEAHREDKLAEMQRHIDDIDRYLDDDQPKLDTKRGDEPKRATPKRGPTTINTFLRERWEVLQKPSARTLVLDLKRFVGAVNSPVKKYHGWHHEVCIDWLPGSGSSTLSWGKKKFQNKVSEFRREDKEREDIPD